MSELHPFERYVALGDSSTEGLDDPDGHGGYHGWANRLAETIARQQGRTEENHQGRDGDTPGAAPGRPRGSEG